MLMLDFPTLISTEHAECDTFFCFQNIMSEIRDNFIKSLDGCKSGIGGSMDRILNVLKDADVHTWLHLDKLAIKPEFYLFRYIYIIYYMYICIMQPHLAH